MNRLGILVAMWICLGLIACSQGAASPTAKTIETEGLIPTPISSQSATETPTSTPRPVPTPDISRMVQEAVRATQEAMVPTWTPVPAPTVTPAPSPLPTPTPTNVPAVRHIPAPVVGAQSVLQVRSIQIQNDILSLDGVISVDGYDPSSIQIWHARNDRSYASNCSTDKPLAFIQPGNGSVMFSGQTSKYTWTYCENGVNYGSVTDNVPWLYSQRWTYTLRPRKYIFDPYIYDFGVTANFDHDLVHDLEYRSGVAEGWRVIVFSGERMILNQWVER